jgi:hypothetical protein
MKLYEKFLNESVGLKYLLETYLELRQHFQELGFSEKNLEKPPIYTPLMMKLFHEYNDRQMALFKQVKDYGIDIGWTEYTKYMEPILKKINELTPLSHADYKGGDKRD